MGILNRFATMFRVLTGNIIVISIENGGIKKVDWGKLNDLDKQDKQAVAAKFFKTAYNL